MTTEWKVWVLFCKAFEFDPLEPSEKMFCLFITFLSRSMKASLIIAYLNGVRGRLKEFGKVAPTADNFFVKRFIAGVKRIKGDEVDAKAAFSPRILMEIFKKLNFSAAEDWAL